MVKMLDTLFALLHYQFFVYAIIGMVIIGVASGIIGTYVMSRRLVAISGGVTHACFGGLGLGYFLGVSPLLMAGVFAVASSVGVEWMSSRHRIREDSAIAVIWSIGMAIGVLFVFMTPGYVPELNSFLFGDILNITRSDLYVAGAIGVLLVLFLLCFYRTIVACAFDRDFAAVHGLPVRFITYVMTVFVAVCIVLTIRLVGVMLLMAVLTLPQMTAEVWVRRFGSIMLLSTLISVVCGVASLFVSGFVDVPCSALIVIAMAAVYAVSRIAKTVVERLAVTRDEAG